MNIRGLIGSRWFHTWCERHHIDAHHVYAAPWGLYVVCQRCGAESPGIRWNAAPRFITLAEQRWVAERMSPSASPRRVKILPMRRV